MKSRREIYAEETDEILRCIETYHCILPEQVYRLFPDYEEAFAKNVITRLSSRKELYHDQQSGCLFKRKKEHQIDKHMIKAIWVLLDHLDRLGGHTAGEYPINLSFVEGGRLYDVAVAAPGEELLLSMALTSRKGEPTPCFVVLEYPEQMEQMDCPKGTVFCIVAPDGKVSYLNGKETRIEPDASN